MSFESGPYVQGKSKPLRLYYFVGPNHWEENLQKQRIKLAEVSQLNDTFDLLTPASDNTEERKKSRWFVETTGELFGLICMSKVWTSPLMWAHYADCHKGICIGFDVDPARFSKVSYVKQRPTLESLGCETFESLGTNQLLEMGRMKFKAWEYEKEYRYFIYKRDAIEEKPLYFQPFCYWLQPRSIIIGQRCEASRSQVLDALGKDYYDIKIWKARSAFRSFKMVRRRNWNGT